MYHGNVGCGDGCSWFVARCSLLVALLVGLTRSALEDVGGLMLSISFEHPQQVGLSSPTD